MGLRPLFFFSFLLCSFFHSDFNTYSMAEIQTGNPARFILFHTKYFCLNVLLVPKNVVFDCFKSIICSFYANLIDKTVNLSLIFF